MSNDLCTHQELVQAVARWRDNGKRRVFSEVAVGSKWLEQHCPIPDVYTLELSYTPKQTAYECKASRADLLADLRARKWSRYLPICTRLSFVVPRGLADKSEIPEECGLITWVPGTDKWQTVRAAPVRKCQLTDYQWLALLFAGHTEHVRVRDCEERERALRNAGLIPDRKRLAGDVRRKIDDLDDLIRRERWTCTECEEALLRQVELRRELESQVMGARSRTTKPIAALLRQVALALDSGEPYAIAEFLRHHVVGYQEGTNSE